MDGLNLISVVGDVVYHLKNTKTEQIIRHKNYI